VSLQVGNSFFSGEPHMTIGNAMRAARKASDMTAAQVADKIGLKEATYLRYERDEVSPQAHVCVALAEAYGISLDQLLRGIDTATDMPRQVINFDVAEGQTLSVAINATVKHGKNA
jgi:transcriptional regulator with XRE-family HTH domain